MLLQVCVWVCVSVFQLCCSTAVQLHDWFCCVERRTGPPSSWLALRAAANCQDHFLLPSSLRFPAEQAGYTQTRLCSAAADAAQREEHVCSGLPGHTQSVWYSLSHAFTDTQAVCQYNLEVCATDLACKDGVVCLLFSTNHNQRLIFSLSASRWPTHQYSPFLLQKCTTVSTCIEILYNNLIHIHVMPNNGF